MFEFSNCGCLCSISDFGFVLEPRNKGILEISDRTFPHFPGRTCISDLAPLLYFECSLDCSAQ